jgi:hypothetical protein
MASTAFPFMTAYDPPGTSEGTLDPMGLYQIADQLATLLVPAIRERMQRVRFLTAMAVGAIITEDLEDDGTQRDASPYLVWEWLVIEALVRKMREDEAIWGAPGTLLARRALDQHGYLDARSYLKTPRIFGFNGVYKRLAAHLGLVDVNLHRGRNADALADAWARGIGYSGLTGAKLLLDKWKAGLKRSLAERPPRTKTNWSTETWFELAKAFAPQRAMSREKKYLRDLLLSTDSRRMGAFRSLWELQPKFIDLGDDAYLEESLHDNLEKKDPSYGPLLNAIRAYEAFGRSLQDAFDTLRAEASVRDVRGFSISAIAGDADLKKSVSNLHARFERAHRALGEVTGTAVSPQALFTSRFQAFGEPQDPASVAAALLVHHEVVQKAKSAEGKRPWFDRIGPDRIYVRQAYRTARRDIQPGRYVHDYRGRPIRRFYRDLT